MSKHAKSKHVPKPQKHAALLQSPESHSNQSPVWSVSRFDRHGPWGQSILAGVDFWENIFEKLKAYEGMTWAQIKANKKRDHAVPMDELIPGARKRLEQLRLDDVDELFRFRFDGTTRLWGIIRGQVFQLLWWDENHEICPSPLKHT